MNKVLKWVLVAVALAIGANVAKEAVKANKEVDARIAVIGSCERQAKKTPNLPADKAKLICQCTADKTEKALGRDSFRRLGTDPAKSPEADKKTLVDSLTACMDEHLPAK